MFNNTKKKEAARTGSSLPMGGNLNSLAAGTRIEGTIHAENDIRIDGSIKGKLYCSAKVIIGPTGKLEGDIQCQSAVVEGQFEGTLQATDSLQISEKAKVSGELYAGRLIVQPGAVINGSFDMGGAKRELPNGHLNGNNKLAAPTEARKIVESNRT